MRENDGVCDFFNFSFDRIPKGRWFLAVIARSHMLLAVILESRHDNTTGSDVRSNITPSPFYIEEIQDTFEHLKTGGIENLASTWIQSNKRPQVNIPRKFDK